MAHDELSERTQLHLYAHKNGLFNGDVGRAVEQILTAGIPDAFSTQWLREQVARHQVARAFAGPFDVPELEGGSFTLGLDARGRRVRADPQYLNAHLCCLGGSGSGKTNRIRFWALGMASHVDGLWLFDLRKSEFGALAGAMARLDRELIGVPARAMRLNPLQVPLHVEPRAWAATVADMLVHVLWLQSRSAKLLHTAVLELYEGVGIDHAPWQRDPSVAYPTLFDLREIVATWRDAHPQARSAITDALDPILRSLGAEVLGCRFGWMTMDLARFCLAFEFSGVARAEQDLLLNTLLLSEFSSRIARGVSNAPMDLYVCIDEAARLVSAANPSVVVSDLLGLVRGAGVGIDLSFQSAHDVHPAVYSNTATKLIGRVGSATDLDALGAAMALTHEQRRAALHDVRPGRFIAQLGEGNWRRPFLLDVPFLHLERLGAPRPTANALRALPVRLASGSARP